MLLSLSGIAHAQNNLATAGELVLNQPRHQLDALIRINLQDAKVRELLDAIVVKSGFRFVYDRSVLGHLLL